MPNRPIPHSPCLRNIFRMIQIMVRRRQQLIRLAETVMRAQPVVNGEWIGIALAIVNRRPLNLTDGCINLSNSSIIIPPHAFPRPAIVQIMPRRAQIAQRVKISRVRPRNLCLHHHRRRCGNPRQ